MITIQEYLLSKKHNKLENTIHATDGTIKQIVKDEIKRLGNDADLNHIDTSKVTDMSYLFDNIGFFGDVSDWDVSNTINFTYMFYNCEEFNCDLSKWDTTNLVKSTAMFRGCEKFEGIGLENWRIYKIEVADRMFEGCINFNANISAWDMKNCWFIDYMFYDCKKFRQDLSGWEFKKMKYHHHIGCKSVFTHSKMSGHKELWPKELIL